MKAAGDTGRDRFDETIKLVLLAFGVFVTACIAVRLARIQNQVSPVWWRMLL